MNASRESGNGLYVAPGTRSTIAMDGVFCTRAGNGSITIRKRNLRNWLVLIFLSMCLLGMLALLFASIGALFREGWSLDALLDIGTIVAITGVMAAAVLVLIRSLRGPSIRIDTITKVMEVGRGPSRRSVPFADVSHVGFERISRHVVEEDEMAVFGINVVLSDGDTLSLGTVSGETAKAMERAAAVTRLIAETLDVDWSE
jgi:hypothetical protein